MRTNEHDHIETRQLIELLIDRGSILILCNRLISFFSFSFSSSYPHACSPYIHMRKRQSAALNIIAFGLSVNYTCVTVTTHGKYAGRF